MAHVLHAPPGLPAGRKGFRKKIVQGGPMGQAFAELGRRRPQFFLAQRLHLVFKLVNLSKQRAGFDDIGVFGIAGADVAELADETFIAGAEDAHEKTAGLLGQSRQTIAELLPETNVHGC